MGKALHKKRLNVIVRDGVVDDFSFASEIDQMHMAQDLQVVGNSRLAHAQQGTDVAHAHFRMQ